MRKQFVTTVESVLAGDERLMLLLGDIGVFGFNKTFQTYPGHVYNIGILEQSTIGLAAGLAMTGFIPVVHTIAPFLVERAYEQLKLDFGYQQLGGNFVSVGASYDYAALGCTHHCPGDVGILKNIPGMEVILPGTAQEFDTLFKAAYADGKPTYFRISERENTESRAVVFGQAEVVKKGNQATVIAIGPSLKPVLEACEGLDVTILYYTTVAPFDQQTLQENCSSGKIVLVEPNYVGTLAHEVTQSLAGEKIMLGSIGVPREFLTNYGKAEDHDKTIGLTVENIRHRLEKLLAR